MLTQMFSHRIQNGSMRLLSVARLSQLDIAANARLLSRVDFNQPSSWTTDLLDAQISNTRQSYSAKAMALNRESDPNSAMAAVSAGFVLLLAAVATAVFFRSCGFAYSPPTSTAATASLAVETQRKQRGVRLRQVNPFADDNTTPEKGIDIIAVHGLDTRSPET
ncbi:peptidase C14, partial [Colletotrichum sojae]